MYTISGSVAGHPAESGAAMCGQHDLMRGAAPYVPYPLPHSLVRAHAMGVNPGNGEVASFGRDLARAYAVWAVSGKGHVKDAERMKDAADGDM